MTTLANYRPEVKIGESCIDALPPTKSDTNAGYEWMPTSDDSGVLTIKMTRAQVGYSLTKSGEEFKLTKVIENGCDADLESYTVRCGKMTGCTCKGFFYSKNRTCKHIATIKSILDNGWM